jgi:Tfp pilus assembly protein PilF
VELDGDLAMAHVARGIVLLQAPKNGDAGPELERALELDPRSSQAHMWMAEYLYRKGERELSEQHFRLAVELNREDWNPHLYYGVFLMKAARHEHAAREWEEARALCDDNIMILSRLAAAYLKMDREDDAAAVLQRALEVQPTATIYNNLATLRFVQGRYSDAAAAFGKAVEIVPSAHLYWGNLGDALRWIPGEKQKAHEAYRHAIHLADEGLLAKPNDAQLLSYLALYTAKSGYTKRALAYIGRLELISHRTADSFFKSCIVFEITGNRPSALRDLKIAIELGYLFKDLQNEPELVSLRSDHAYHQIISKTQSAMKQR